MRVLTGDELRAFDERALRELLERRDLALAIGDGELRGIAAAACLSCDFAILAESATLFLDTPHVFGAVVWRIGSRAIALPSQLSATEAFELGVCDAIGDGRDWLRGRSEIALDSAAALIRNRGGDALERAEFARLFAASIPQEGLRAFLGKRKPGWRRE